MEFKKVFNDLLDENNLSAKQLGKLIDINHNSVYLYDKNKYPDIANAVKIANYFNCSLNYLFGLDFDSNSYSYKSTYNIKEFINRYQYLLKKFNVSNHKVSIQAKTNESSYWLWRKGSEPKIETLIKLAQYFNVSIDYLIGRSDEE